MSAFTQASGFFVACVATVPDEAWPRAGLGEWTVRALVAHGNRAHTTVEDYLLRPVEPVGPDSPYFSEAAIAERGREAERALGDDPAGAVATTSARVVALVAGTPPDAVLGTPGGPVALADYLPSRTAEFVVHGLDVLTATGEGLEPPADAVAETLRFLADRAAGRGAVGVQVVRALTGRGDLPAGFSLY